MFVEAYIIAESLQDEVKRGLLRRTPGLPRPEYQVLNNSSEFFGNINDIQEWVRESKRLKHDVEKSRSMDS